MARFKEREYESNLLNGQVRYMGPGFNIQFDAVNPAQTVSGKAEASVDLTYFEIMEKIRWGILESGHVNYASVVAKN